MWGGRGRSPTIIIFKEGDKSFNNIYIYIYIHILDVQVGAKAPICTRSLRSLLKARISELKTSELKPRISELKLG